MADDDQIIDLSDKLYEALRRQVEATGRTPDEEARTILMAALSAPPARRSDSEGSA